MDRVEGTFFLTAKGFLIIVNEPEDNFCSMFNKSSLIYFLGVEEFPYSIFPVLPHRNQMARPLL